MVVSPQFANIAARVSRASSKRQRPDRRIRASALIARPVPSRQSNIVNYLRPKSGPEGSGHFSLALDLVRSA